MRGSLKVWMVILTITVLGGGITFFTNSYVSSELEKMAATEYSALKTSGAEAKESRMAAAEETGGQEFSGEARQEQPMAAAPVLGAGMPDAAEPDDAREDGQVQINEAADTDGDGGLREGDGAVTDDQGMERDAQAGSGTWMPDDTDMGNMISEGEEPAEEVVSEEAAPEAKAEVRKSTGGEKTGGQAAMSGSTAKTAGEQAVEIVADDGLDVQERLAEYEQRLPELDVQIEAIRTSETDNPTINSVKTTAQTELRIWEREMDGIYRIICESLDDEAAEDLKKEQQEWIKQRNSKAEAAAKKNSGGTLESVDYIASAAASTRERAYELLKLYKE